MWTRASLGSTLDHQLKHYFDGVSRQAKYRGGASSRGVVGYYNFKLAKFHYRLPGQWHTPLGKIGVWKAPNKGSTLLHVERHSRPNILHWTTSLLSSASRQPKGYKFNL
ncbi:hypothetical protein ACFX1T_025373 [Malus domestica]